MNIVEEFSRFANLYDRYNTIQSRVAERVVSMIDMAECNRVLDIGSGNGLIYKYMVTQDIKFNEFIALDFSKEMLKLHPTSKSIKKIYFDFNSREDFNILKKNGYDLVISSSALQWSRDLDMTLREISRLSNLFYFSIFTSATFKTLHRIGKIKSPIYSREEIEQIINRYYTASYEAIDYRLKFSNIYEMLRYIKRSGVSGGKRQLSYMEIKNIIKNYPLDYLEFEVVFIKATSK